jgi:hypothetical protein
MLARTALKRSLAAARAESKKIFASASSNAQNRLLHIYLDICIDVFVFVCVSRVTGNVISPWNTPSLC